jgi:LacI family transcriptional regulator
MSVTIKDVAEYTNLSVTTVSLVLNGKADTVNICEATVQRVQKAAQKLNYKPNLLARSLRRGRTNIIGFVMSDVGNTFFTSLAGHIEREALRRGYRVLFGGANENDDACIDTIDAFVHLHVDGLLIVPTDGVYSRLKRLQEQNETPFVLIDRYFDGLEVDSVLMNNYRSAFDAVELLIAHGRKRIATVCYNTGLLHIEERRQGYCAALDKHGIAYSDSLMPRVSFSKIDDREMLRIMRRLIEVERVDGIIFQTNLAALAGIKAIAALGCKVPEQV